MPVRPRLPRLGVEPLEDRTVPAQFGSPWSDPTHLTISFAPDGTRALGLPSRALAALGRTMPAAVWQQAVLRAVQTWSEAANVNVALVPDGGQKFGAEGPPQGDGRFGDIRVGGVAMSADALAATVPPDPAVVGTLAGDLFVNTRARFTFQKLYGVALHEVGHALGLAPSTDPASVMFNTFNQILALAPSDVSAIQALYGTRGPDAHEGSNGNDTVATAADIDEPGSYDGRTPLVVFGEITAPGDVDVYELRNQNDYRGPITFRLQTTGVSLLAARLVITNAEGRVLASATGGGVRGGTLTVTLPRSAPGKDYFVRVEAAPGAFADVGRYGLGVTFNGLRAAGTTPLGQVLRGPYDALDADDVEALFRRGEDFYNDDLGTDDDPALAGELAPLPGFPEESRYTVTASLTTPSDADFYTVRAPQTEDGTAVLTAVVRAVGPNGTKPRVQLFKLVDDTAGQVVPVPARVLANAGGTFAVQAAGVEANADYVLRVGDAAAPGNYVLDVSFLARAAQVETLTSGSLATGKTLASTLYVGRSQAFGLALSAVGPVGSTVRFSILNAAGREVFALAAPAGDTVTGSTVLLAPGKYSLRVTATGPAGTVQFSLDGGVITDPIGPQPADSVTAPQYQDPTDPSAFLYPDTTASTFDPYLWLSWFPI